MPPPLVCQGDEEEEEDGRRGKKRLKRSRFVDDIAAVDEDEEDEEDDQVHLGLVKHLVPVLFPDQPKPQCTTDNLCHRMKVTSNSCWMRVRSCQRWRTWAGGVHATQASYCNLILVSMLACSLKLLRLCAKPRWRVLGVLMSLMQSSCTDNECEHLYLYVYLPLVSREAG